MARSQGFSTKSTNGSAHAYGLPHTGDNDEVSLDHVSDQKALSMKRLDDFFRKDDFKFNSPYACGHTIICSATQNMQKQLQAFDQVFNVNDSTTEGQARRQMSGTTRKNEASTQSAKEYRGARDAAAK